MFPFLVGWDSSYLCYYYYNYIFFKNKYRRILLIRTEGGGRSSRSAESNEIFEKRVLYMFTLGTGTLIIFPVPIRTGLVLRKTKISSSVYIRKKKRKFRFLVIFFRR